VERPAAIGLWRLSVGASVTELSHQHCMPHLRREMQRRRAAKRMRVVDVGATGDEGVDGLSMSHRSGDHEWRRSVVSRRFRGGARLE